MIGIEGVEPLRKNLASMGDQIAGQGLVASRGTAHQAACRQIKFGNGRGGQRHEQPAFGEQWPATEAAFGKTVLRAPEHLPVID